MKRSVCGEKCFLWIQSVLRPEQTSEILLLQGLEQVLERGIAAYCVVYKMAEDALTQYSFVKGRLWKLCAL